MRQIVLDTETTGLEPDRGHRVVEIGCIELIERRRSGTVFHRYLNPERDIDAGALEVTGLTRDFLSDKPRFAAIAGELLAFLDGAELVIHNAAFDMGFLEAEFARLSGFGSLGARVRVLDTLALARERFPGQRNSLDALCRRYGIDNSHRTLHGAMLDAALLADVYLAMTAGQGALELAGAPSMPVRERSGGERELRRGSGRIPLRRVDPNERRAHEQRLDAIEKAAKATSLWRQLEADAV
jgi:DNA polymerase-3 subunit epsilon